MDEPALKRGLDIAKNCWRLGKRKDPVAAQMAIGICLPNHENQRTQKAAPLI